MNSSTMLAALDFPCIYSEIHAIYGSAKEKKKTKWLNSQSIWNNYSFQIVLHCFFFFICKSSIQIAIILSNFTIIIEIVVWLKSLNYFRPSANAILLQMFRLKHRKKLRLKSINRIQKPVSVAGQCHGTNQIEKTRLILFFTQIRHSFFSSIRNWTELTCDT